MPHPSDKIGPYTLVREIGRGSYGYVWLAERRTEIVTTELALKILKDEIADLKDVKQETQLWAAASKHDNILTIFEADIYDGHIVIVSEYIVDGTLEGWLKNPRSNGFCC